jgi:hypothetical protein
MKKNFHYNETKTSDGRAILFIDTQNFHIRSSFFKTSGAFEAFIELRDERIIVGMGGGDTAHNAIRNAITETRKVETMLRKLLKGDTCPE